MKIAIIGGGVIGLSVAYYLSKQGIGVNLFEKDKKLGGISSSFKVDKKHELDKFYRHIFNCDKHLIEMISELGLSKDIRWNHSKMGLFYNLKSYDFSSQADFLQFKPLNFLEKFKFGLITFYLSKLKNWKKLESISAENWLRKSAEKSYFVIWKPLLTSKFGNAYKKIPMSWFWNKIWYRMHTRKKLFSKEVQGYLMGSFQLMIDSMEKIIKQNNGRTFTNSNIKKIYRKKDKIIVEAGKKKFSFDRVIVTTALPIFLMMTKGLPENYKKKLRKIGYRASLVLVLKLKKSFMPYYWLSINDKEIPFVMLMEHTNFIPKEYYDDFPILYISRYTTSNDKYYKFSKIKLIKTYAKYLKKINPNFDESWIKQSWVFKSDYGTHIPTLDYSKKIIDYETPIKNLYLATGCQIYPVDRGMSESIALGKKIAKVVIENKNI